VEQITLVAIFHADGSITFDRLADPSDVLTYYTEFYNTEFFPIDIHLHGGPKIAVSVLAENVEGKHLTYEHIKRFRDALNIEIAKYGHRPLPPDAFDMFMKRM
jgi:hypothetical protein